MGVGVAGTFSPTQHLTYDVATDEDLSQEPVNANRLSGGLYLSGYDSEGRFGVGLTLGLFTLGVDATTQLWKRNYLTAALSIPGQAHVFLQHRTYNSPRLGAAVGVGYQRDAVALEGPTPLSVDLGAARVHSFGIRGMSVLRAEGDTGGGIKLSTYVGYAPAIQRPLFGLTLATGRF
ncbi:MAG: hypothetical protein R6U20_07170 [Longimonas sp.]|uniref:hypothetical protein n=1 Tax=Longimonas sp. TaxID=2039626 RepID=UPI003976B738